MKFLTVELYASKVFSKMSRAKYYEQPINCVALKYRITPKTVEIKV